MVKRNYPPGFHGPSQSRRRLTDYGEQLNEKQKARKQYGLMEKQFKLTFEKASRHGGNTAENFLSALEMRLDNVVFRAGLAASRMQARQLVNHGHFSLNNKKAMTPSIATKVGDEIKIKENKTDNRYFKNIAEKLKNSEAVGWLSVDVKKGTIKVLQAPDAKTINPNFNTQMIIEYYSR